MAVSLDEVSLPQEQPVRRMSGSFNNVWTKKPVGAHNGTRSTMLVATYAFDAEADDELSFQKGDRITLVARVDDEWMKGSLRGRTGIFPTSYVKEEASWKRG